MKIECTLCDTILKEPGAIIFLPPVDYVAGKYHLCTKCWKKWAKKMNVESNTRILIPLVGD